MAELSPAAKVAGRAGREPGVDVHREGGREEPNQVGVGKAELQGVGGRELKAGWIEPGGSACCYLEALQRQCNHPVRNAPAGCWRPGAR